MLRAVGAKGAGFDRRKQVAPQGRMLFLDLGERGADAVGDSFARLFGRILGIAGMPTHTVGGRQLPGDEVDLCLRLSAPFQK